MSGRFVSRLPLENDVSIRLLSISGSSYDNYKTNLITGGQRSWVTVVDRILFGSHRSPQEVSYLPLDFIFCPFLPLKEGTHHQQPFLLSISRISCLPSGHRQQAFNSRSRQSENRLLAATRFGRFFQGWKKPRVLVELA